MYCLFFDERFFYKKIPLDKGPEPKHDPVFAKKIFKNNSF